MHSGLNELLQKALAENKAFVAWRNPNEKKLNTFSAYARELSLEEVMLPQKGFLFFPFNCRKRKGFLLSEENVPTPLSFVQENTEKSTSEDHYEKMIELAKRELSGSFNKVVPARCLVREKPSGFDALEFFTRLLQEHTSVFVYFFTVPGFGTWLGATPETLLSWDSESLFTVSLAGTAWQNGQQIGTKEYDEQGIVTDYVKKVLENVGAKDIQVKNQKTVQSGHLEHLFNKIEFHAGSKSTHSLAEKLIPVLHPTPAVCGNPQDKALEFILKHEDFDRSFYSGFLGFVNENERSSLYVNLRCMQVKEHSLVLYAGAGITKNSDPRKEWEETENKIRVIGGILK